MFNGILCHFVQIRDFEYSPETHESRKQELDKLMRDQESLRGSLLQWCYTSYGEVFVFYFSLLLIFKNSPEYYKEFTGSDRKPRSLWEQVWSVI